MAAVEEIKAALLIYAELDKGCDDHPTYRALRRPRTTCERCGHLYKLRQLIKEKEIDDIVDEVFSEVIIEAAPAEAAVAQETTPIMEDTSWRNGGFLRKVG